MTFPLSECCGDYKHAPHDFCPLCPIMGRRHRALYIDHDLSIVKFPDDGQTEGDRGISPAENEAQTRVVDAPASTTPPPSVCPCGVHGDPDGDCGERCA